MPHYTGKAMHITFEGNTLSGDWMSFEFKRTVDVIDVTPAGASDFTGIPGIQHGRWSLTVYDDDAATIAEYLTPGASGDLIFGPHGNSPGSPKFGFPAIVTDIKHAYTYEDTVVVEFSGIKSGAMLFDVGDIF